jgi:hypothetical protein
MPLLLLFSHFQIAICGVSIVLIPLWHAARAANKLFFQGIPKRTILIMPASPVERVPHIINFCKDKIDNNEINSAKYALSLFEQ